LSGFQTARELGNRRNRNPKRGNDATVCAAVYRARTRHTEAQVAGFQHLYMGIPLYRERAVALARPALMLPLPPVLDTRMPSQLRYRPVDAPPDQLG